MLARKALVSLFCMVVAAASLRAAAADQALPPGRDHRFDGDEQGRAERVQKDFQDAGRELAETHARALRQQELREPLEKLRTAMETAMIRLEPAKKGQVLRRYAVHREMIESEKIETPTPLDKERYQALLLEFTNLSEALGDLPKRAAEQPDVEAERARFHEALLAVMTRLDPKVPELMRQQRKSVGEYNELEAALLRKHGGARGAAPAR